MIKINEIIFFHMTEFLSNVKASYLTNHKTIPFPHEHSYLGRSSQLYADPFQKKSPFPHPQITNLVTAKLHKLEKQNFSSEVVLLNGLVKSHHHAT